MKSRVHTDPARPAHAWKHPKHTKLTHTILGSRVVRLHDCYGLPHTPTLLRDAWWFLP